MATQKYITNINCGSCVSKVKSFMDANYGEKNWNVDTTSSEKTLSIEAEKIDEDKLIVGLKELGYKAEKIEKKGFLKSIFG